MATRRAGFLTLMFCGCAPVAVPRTAGPGGSGTVAAETRVTILDRGAPPRRRLHYPTSGFDRAVTLTWSGTSHFRDSHSRLDETDEYLERTVEGTLRDVGPGRQAIELVTGTARPSSNVRSLAGYHDVAANLDAELPFRFELAVTTSQIMPTPLPANVYETAAGFGDATYRDVLLEALPRLLPQAEIGIGARWQFVTREGRTALTYTWELNEIDGDKIVLTGTGGSSPCGQQRPCFRSAPVEVRSAIDLSVFSVDATVTRAALSMSSNALTSSVQESRDAATVTIKSR